MNLNISEIFYSLQGEGARVGKPSIFIRLQGCKAKKACFALGIKCDTEFESGQKLNVDDIFNWCVINGKGCKDIVWTGGEPLDQLTSQIVDFFKQKGFFQCVETSGLYPCPQGIDFISVSPKVAEHVIKKNFPDGVTELRYIRHFGQNIPQPSINAKYYFVSPHSDGININSENLKHCINLCLTNPSWGMSVQSHKIWNIL